MTTRRVAKHEWVEGRLPPDPSGEPDGLALVTSGGAWGKSAVPTPMQIRKALVSPVGWPEHLVLAWDDMRQHDGVSSGTLAHGLELSSGQVWEQRLDPTGPDNAGRDFEIWRDAGGFTFIGRSALGSPRPDALTMTHPITLPTASAGSGTPGNTPMWTVSAIGKSPPICLFYGAGLFIAADHGITGVLIRRGEVDGMTIETVSTGSQFDSNNRESVFITGTAVLRPGVGLFFRVRSYSSVVDYTIGSDDPDFDAISQAIEGEFRVGLGGISGSTSAVTGYSVGGLR